MFKAIFLTCLLISSSSAMSDELVLNLASNHINSIHQFNEKNLGLGYRFDNKVEVGFFQNSYYKNDHERANGTGYSVYYKTT